MANELFFDGMRYVSAAEAAASSNLTRDYIARLAREGKIAGKQIGRQWYVAHESLYAFMSAQESASEQRREALARERQEEYGRTQSTDTAASAAAALSEASCVTASTIQQKLQNAIERKKEYYQAPRQEQAQTAASTQPFNHGIDVLQKVAAATLALALVVGLYTTQGSIAMLLPQMSGVNSSSAGEVAGAADAVGAIANALQRGVDAIFSPLFGGYFASSQQSGVVTVQITQKNQPSAAPSTSQIALAQTSAPAPETTTKTIVEQPVIQRIVQTQPLAASGGVSESELDQRLQQLQNALTEQIYSATAANSTAISQNYLVTAQTNAIDQLQGTAITDASISGGSIANADISGGSISGASISGATFTGTTTLEGLAVAGSATSTYAGGINITGGCVSVNGNCIGTGLASNPGGSDTQVEFNNQGAFAGSPLFTFSTSTATLAVLNASTTNFTATKATSTNATTTNLFVSGTIGLGNALSISSGGTGTSSAPSYGELLVGNGAGGYSLVATSSLGIVGGGGGGGGTSNVSTSSENTWSALQIFAGNASSSNFSNFGTAYFGGTATSSFNSAGQLTLAGLSNAVLGVNTSGQVVATSSIGTNLLTGSLGTINGTSLSVGGSITVNAASSTLLSNNNSWTGLQDFENASNTLTTLGTTWFSGLTNALLATDNNGKVVATTSIGASYITGTLGVSNGGTGSTTLSGILTGNGTGAVTSAVVSSPLSYSGNTLSIAQASGSQSGYLSSADWTTFNGKVSSSSLSAAYPLAYNSSTGVFSLGFGTTTSNTWAGTQTFANISATNATTSSLYVTGVTSHLLKTDANGQVVGAIAGTDYQAAGNYVTALGSGYATTTGTAISLSTSTQSFNGLTIAQTITSPNGSNLLFTPAVSGTLNNSGLTNSAITFSSPNSTLSVPGSTALGGTAAFDLNLGHSNWWATTQNFTNASTSQFTATSSVYFTALSNALLATDQNGKLVSTTTISTGLLSANTIGITNGGGLTVSGSPISLGDSGTVSLDLTHVNNWTGFQTFQNASSTQLSVFSKAYFGGTATTTISSNGDLAVGGVLSLGNVLSCTGGQALQTDGSGNVTCGTPTTGGASSGGGWTTDNTGRVSLSTTTDLAVVGASTTPYAKFTVLSGANATTTFALVPAASQTANIMDIYAPGGGVNSVFTASDWLGIGTTSPGSTLSVSGTAYVTGTTTLGATTTITGPLTLGGIVNSLLSTNASGQVVASSSIGTNLLTGSLGTINGTAFNAGGSITVNAASSTLLSDNNTFSGSNTFTKLLNLTGSASTTELSIFKNFYAGGTATTSIDSAGNLQVGGTLTVNGTATSTFSGNMLVSGNIVPGADNTYTLGLASTTWKSVYIGPGSLFVNGEEVVHTDTGQNVIVSASTNENLELYGTGSTNIVLNPSGTGDIQLEGPVQITGGKAVTTSDGSAVPFTDGLSAGNLELTGNVIQASNLNGGISITPNGNGGTYFTSGNVGIGTTNPGSKLEVEGTVAAQTFNATSTSATSTFANGINLTGGCVEVGGTCIGSGGVTSVSNSDGTLTISPTSGAVVASLALSHANSWTGLQQFANASTTLFSAYGPAYFGGTATSSFNSAGQLTLAGITSALLKTSGSNQIVAAIAGTDYQAPITASYPIQFSGNNLSLAFGTTTANTWSALQTFNGGIAAYASSTIGNGTQTGGLTINGGATTTGNLFITGAGFNSGYGTIQQLEYGSNSEEGIGFNNLGTGGKYYDLFSTNNLSGVGAGKLVIGDVTDAKSLITFNGSGASNIQFNQYGAGALQTDSSGTITTGILGVGYGGTGWANIAANTLLTGNGTGALATTSVGTGLSLSGGTLSNAGVTSVSQTYGTAQTGAITLATSSAVSFNGLTLSNTITNSGGTFSFANTLAGTLNNSGLTNSTISGVSLGSNLFNLSHDSTLSGTSYNGSASVSDWGLNLANANTWTGLQTFANASSSQLSVFNKLYAGGTATTTIDSAGNIIGAGTLSLSGLGTLQSGFLSQASSTVVGNFTSTGLGAFGNGLSVSGATSTFANGITLTSGCLFYNGSCIGANSGTVNSGTAGQLAYYATNGTTISATSSLFLSPAGNVGVGTTSPGFVSGATRYLTLDSNISNGLSALELSGNTQSNNAPIGRISFYNDEPFGGELARISAAPTDNNDAKGALIFSTASQLGTLNEVARFDQLGDFGIGTTSPATLLSVGGNGYLTGGLGVGVLNTTAGTLQSSGNGTIGGVLAVNGTTGTTTIASGQGFTIGGSQLVLQQGSGNVGVGTSTPTYALDVVSTNNNDVARFSSTNSGVGSIIDLDATQGGGGHDFRLVSSGPSNSCLGGNKFSIGDTAVPGLCNGYRLVLDSSGDVGIGTTTPWAKLSISANTSDTNANIFLVSSSTAAATTTLFDVSSNGNVGVGTSTPTYALDVVSTNNNDVARFSSTNSGVGSIIDLDATQGGGGHDFRLVSSGPSNTCLGGNKFSIGDAGVAGCTSYRLVLDSSGNLGIGTTSPGSLLSIGNTNGINFSTGTSTFSTTGGINLASGCFSVNGICVGSTLLLSSTTIGNGTQAGGLTISGGATTTGNAYFAGDIGVGTSTPTYALDVVSTNNNDVARFSSTNNGIGSIIDLDATQGGGGRNYRLVSSGSTNGCLGGNKFSIGDAGVAGCTSYRLVLDSSGNLGIGTTSPGSLLSLGGIANFTTATTSFYSSGGINLIGSGCFSVNGICVGSSLLASTTIGNGTQAGGLTISGGATTTGNAYFAGDIGVGTSTPTYALDVVSTNNNDVARFSSTNSGVGSIIDLDATQGGGGHDFRLVSSGPSNSCLGGNKFSIGDTAVPGLCNGYRLVLDSSGNLGIGTTSPFTKLGVAGDAYIGGNLTATGTVAFTGLGSGIVGSSNGQLYTFASSSLTAASSTLLSDNNTFSGSNIFSNTLTLTNGFVAQASSTVVGNFTTTGFVNTSGTTGGYEIDGNNVLYASTTNNTLAVGASSAASWMSASSTPWYSVAIGPGALASTPTNGGVQSNTAVGNAALHHNTTGIDNTAVGDSSLFFNTGNWNTAIGSAVLYNNTTGGANTAVGYHTLNANSTGSSNTANGFSVMYSNTTGGSNTANGMYSLYSNTTGNNNSAFGLDALYKNVSATNTVAIGYEAANGTASYNNQGGTYLGYQSGYSAGTGSNYNTLLGYQAGYDVTTGANNIVIGQEQTTGKGITTSSGNIFLGNDLQLATSTGNELNIGNLLFGTGLSSGSTLSSGNIGIGTSSPYASLSVQNAGATSSPILVLADPLGNTSLEIRAGTSTLDNVFVGTGAGAVNTTGSDNVANGYQALQNNTSGPGNVANGFKALNSNTYGAYNVANGYDALLNNTGGGDNVANGTQALYHNTTGNDNIANGYDALFVNTTGNYNVANGYMALYLNSTGSNNTANGYQALYNTTGNDNTANGYQALYTNSTGAFNVANGLEALYLNSTGYGNIASGYQALYHNTTGGYNIANGYTALWDNTTGSENIANGLSALYSNTSGGGNVANGYQALYNNTTGQLNLVEGYLAGQKNTIGTSTTLIGAFADASANNLSTSTAIGAGAIVGCSNCLVLGGTGQNAVNVGIGTTTPWAKLSISANNGDTNTNLFLISSSTASATTTLFSISNTGVLALSPAAQTGDLVATFGGSNFLEATSSSVGTLALGYQAGQSLLATSTAAGNTVFGYQALNAATSSIYNTAIGYQALASVDDYAAQSNTAVGYRSLVNDTTGETNTALGYESMFSNTTGNNNSAYGYLALDKNSSGGSNMGFGSAALYGNTTGGDNIAIGTEAENGNYSTYVGNDNVAIGTQAGFYFQNGASDNTLIGYKAGSDITTGANNIIFGSRVDAPVVSGNQQLNIGNILYGTNLYNGGSMSSAPVLNGNIGIGTSTPWAKLAISANNGDTNKNLFLVSSSTASATSTLFSISNTGQVTAGGGNFSVDGSGNVSAADLYVDTSNEYSGLYVQSSGAYVATLYGSAGGNDNGQLGLYDSNTQKVNLVASGSSYFNGGNVGIGTSSPGSLLSLNGIANFTAATSTFYSSGGINLAGGCFSVNGTCVGGSGSSGSGGGQLLATYATSTPGNNVSINFNGSAGSSPSFSSGTLTLPSNTSYVVIQLWGGGGGGGGGNGDSTGTGTTGSAGGQTCFGTNSTACTSPLSTANAGSGGLGGAENAGQAGGAGGTSSGGDINVTGGTGSSAVGLDSSTGIFVPGGIGGAAYRGGSGGAAGAYGTVGGVGNSYGGGGAGGYGRSVSGYGAGGSGGGAGGYSEKLINNPSGTYYYTVGGGGGGGGASGNGTAGGAGGAGGIIISVYTTGISQGAIGSGTQGEFAFYNSSTATTSLSATSSIFIAQSGNIGIGTTNPTTPLQVAGTSTLQAILASTPVLYNGSSISTSDPSEADIVLGKSQNGAGRHDSSIMFWNNNSAERISADYGGFNTNGNFYFTDWSSGTTSPGVILGANSGGKSYFSGDVGVGTSTPWAQLSVTSPTQESGSTTLFGVASTTGASLFSVTGDGTATFGNSTGSGDAVMQFASDSNAWAVGYKSSDQSFDIASSTNLSGTAALSIAKNGNATFTGSGGTCTINGSGACTSDIRLKNVVATTTGPEALAGLAKLNAITYTWKDPSLDQSLRLGVIAQQVMQAFPELVGSTTVNFEGTPGTYYTVNYGGLTAPLISAVNQVNGVFDAASASTSAPTILSLYQGTTTPITVDQFGDLGIGTSTATTTTDLSLCLNGSCVTSFPYSYSATSSATSTPTMTLSQSFLSAIENALSQWFAQATNGIQNFFANTIHTNQICVSDSTGSSTCLTKAQLDALLAGAGNTGSSSSGSGSSESTPTATTTAPILQINGNNPATVSIGATYDDLGATITGPTADLNLGVQASVDGATSTAIADIHIDTSKAGTHTITYTATDQNGVMGSAVRTVVVIDPNVTSTATSTNSTSTSNITASSTPSGNTATSSPSTTTSTSTSPTTSDASTASTSTPAVATSTTTSSTSTPTTDTSSTASTGTTTDATSTTP